MSDEENLILEDFSSICRTCLLKYEDESLLCLNELYIVDGEIRLMDILSKYTQIEENEHYPQKMCTDCIIKAEAAYCFFVKCNESNLILSQFSSTNDTEEILDGFQCNGNEENEQESNCEVIKLINDEDQEDMEIKIILAEDDCGNEIDETNEFGSCDEKFTIDHVASLNTNNHYSLEKCKFCNIELEVEELEEHKVKLGHYDDSEMIKCPYCDIITRNITNMKQHLRKFHSNRKESKKHVCDICCKVFKWSKNYKEHLKSHNSNPEEKVMCPECGILLGNVTALQIHRGKEHVQTLNMSWNCKHCSIIFRQIAEFKKHLREVHAEKDFHCIICGKDCEDKRTLYYHEQLHLDDYGLDCTYCTKKLLTEEKLLLHQRIHKYVNKKHVCTFCNKGFKQLDKLEAHERVHTGEKPFKCSFCGKAFNHQNNLRHHIRLHTGDTPYKCLFCSKEFSNSHSLRKHMSTHDNNLSDKMDNYMFPV
ncbi:zinc finger protein 852-like [Coccinella septempunctata]|uniref:zinc finger protein 852-like n=1 Tax=Coccinella septempunctata TaxID=41139 RepID=UPI001D07581A|nr:zinc finger protein 852-like [Coccinella septempunctata]